jgi:hypothetical protein
MLNYTKTFFEFLQGFHRKHSLGGTRRGEGGCRRRVSQCKAFLKASPLSSDINNPRAKSVARADFAFYIIRGNIYRRRFRKGAAVINSVTSFRTVDHSPLANAKVF